jgi:hypothetical protein
MLGVDFAGTIKYQFEGKKEKKAYLALFACSLTRAVDLDLGISLETEDLIMCFKKFIYCEKTETRTSLFRQWNDNQGSGKVVTEGEKA